MNLATRFFLLCLACLTTPALAQEPQATPVQVDRVRTETMSQTVPVIGRLVALQGGVVAARSPGPVAELPVQVGDHVEAGQPVAELDTARLQAAVDRQQAQIQELEARLASAQASERLARQELSRLERLRNSAAFNRSLYDTRVLELEAARSARREAEARISSGQVALALAQIELKDATVRAPYPGTVTLRHVAQGAWLRVGDPVVTLVSDENLEVEADVPAERLAGLKPGVRVRLTLPGSDTTHQAVVRAVIPDENPTARTRPVRFVPEFRAVKTALARNQPVTLRLPAGAADEVVTVHKDAILRQGGRALVYVVGEGVAQPRPVVLGDPVGQRFRVLDGLRPGDLVVVRGNERLRPGQAVFFDPPKDAVQG